MAEHIYIKPNIDILFMEAYLHNKCLKKCMVMKKYNIKVRIVGISEVQGCEKRLVILLGRATGDLNCIGKCFFSETVAIWLSIHYYLSLFIYLKYCIRYVFLRNNM